MRRGFRVRQSWSCPTYQVSDDGEYVVWKGCGTVPTHKEPASWLALLCTPVSFTQIGGFQAILVQNPQQRCPRAAPHTQSQQPPNSVWEGVASRGGWIDPNIDVSIPRLVSVSDRYLRIYFCCSFSSIRSGNYSKSLCECSFFPSPNVHTMVLSLTQPHFAPPLLTLLPHCD